MELMEAALALASSSRLLSAPNPAVGCIIVSDGDRRLGQGSTQAAGGPHAEIMALRDAAARGNTIVGGTAYVTLEPCAHHGRTGPCCDALIDAGLGKVVVAAVDPNPLVRGQGLARLRASGVQVELLPPDAPLAKAARELNLGFFSRMLRGRPWVRLKVAASLDGTTALPDGTSQWITSEAARADGHGWRARAGALLTGIGTVLQDDPRLDVRLAAVHHQPPLAVVDSRLELPVGARLLATDRPIWIYTAQPESQRWQNLRARGAEVVYLPGAGGKVDLAAVLKDLARREVNELHVEAGFKLNGSLVREGLVDEFLLYLAPKLLGQGQGIASFGPLASLQDAVGLEFTSTALIGGDLRLVARTAGRDRF